MDDAVIIGEALAEVEHAPDPVPLGLVLHRFEAVGEELEVVADAPRAAHPQRASVCEGIVGGGGGDQRAGSDNEEEEPAMHVF